MKEFDIGFRSSKEYQNLDQHLLRIVIFARTRTMSSTHFWYVQLWNLKRDTMVFYGENISPSALVHCAGEVQHRCNRWHWSDRGGTEASGGVYWRDPGKGRAKWYTYHTVLSGNTYICTRTLLLIVFLLMLLCFIMQQRSNRKTAFSFLFCQLIQDPRWQVGNVYTPADAIAQGLKTLSLNETRFLSRTVSDWFRQFEEWFESAATIHCTPRFEQKRCIQQRSDKW